MAPLILWWHIHIRGKEFDFVQGIGGNFMTADITYAHFCHRVYLHEHTDARPKQPVRRMYSWLYDSVISLLEPLIYRRAKYIVTPSEGLARELTRNFAGATVDKIHVIANPVDVHQMLKPADYNPRPMRESLQFQPDDFVMVFVGAGHFERKGLPVLLDAMQQMNHPTSRLIVVGGTNYLVDQYRRRTERIGLGDHVQFVGFQHDIRPYLWASDLFVFPSAYEVFPLVSLEAAAAGLPLLCAPLNGVEEFLQDGYNGWEVERSAARFAEKIDYAVNHREQIARMGQQAVQTVMDYTPDAFGQHWLQFYNMLETSLNVSSAEPPLQPVEQTNHPCRVNSSSIKPIVLKDKLSHD
jgi:glycosyltransferase involved in cell wall biosynthesis